MRAPLRIRYPENLIKSSDKQLKSFSEDQSTDMNSYLQRLVKLIPAEAVSIHLTIKSFVNEPPEKEEEFLPVIGLIAVLIVRIFGSRVETDSSKWNIEWALVGISVISYILWVLGTGWEFKSISFIEAIPDSWIGATILLWTFAIPYIYKPRFSN